MARMEAAGAVLKTHGPLRSEQPHCQVRLCLTVKNLARGVPGAGNRKKGLN